MWKCREKGECQEGKDENKEKKTGCLCDCHKISEVKKTERKIEKWKSIAEKEQVRYIDRRRERERGSEEINDLNNNAALCIHCHTLALHHHQDCLSDTHESRPSVWFMLHHEAVCKVDSPSSSSPFTTPLPIRLSALSLSFSLRLRYPHHHVLIKSLQLNLLRLLHLLSVSHFMHLSILTYSAHL